MKDQFIQFNSGKWTDRLHFDCLNAIETKHERKEEITMKFVKYSNGFQLQYL